MSRFMTRRQFARTATALAVAASSPVTWPALAKEARTSEGSRLKTSQPRYRAVSWWLTQDDLAWPNPGLRDKIRRRADQCAANHVNCCFIFGAHFRWDFMPLWGRLHEELRFIADELHQRRILLFDHHSSVLTRRPRIPDDPLSAWEHNRHHIRFYPSLEEAKTWQFKGSHLNNWRMIDVGSGAPVYLPAYTAEQFCMNNPSFRAAYGQYVKQLRPETGIDGLMSDDGIFYAGWRACACEHCRNRFKQEYGHTLPPVSDTDFWGNRHSEAFRDWIAMRFRSSGDFLGVVKNVLPSGFPLLTCCSNSDGYNLPAFGMSDQDFIKNCNHVMLEMVGSTPSLTGTWDNRIPTQLLHLGIARKHQVPCFGLGYGFFPDTAFFVWAMNKFLGSDCWFSTLKVRLVAPEAELDLLADDAELVGEGYRWEQAHPQLFSGKPDTDVAVLFSRATRDYYGEVAGDYSSDYSASCLDLVHAGVPCEVVTEIPKHGRMRCLVLGSVICLSNSQRGQLASFLKAGGTIIATGPTGHYDERASPAPKSWLEDFGVSVELIEPSRSGGFPPYQNFKAPVALAECRVSESVQRQMRDGWFVAPAGKGCLFWRPERINAKGIANSTIKLLDARDHARMRIQGLPEIWRVRQHRDGNRLLIHALPGKVGTVLHSTLQNHQSHERIIEKLVFAPLTTELVVEFSTALKSVVLHSPDLTEPRVGRSSEGQKWSIDPINVSRYFVLECVS
jgi:hypothetical protein